MKRKRSQVKFIKARLKIAGVTYDEVARFAGVSWRMVKYVIDGERTSAKVMRAINKLSGISGDGYAA